MCLGFCCTFSFGQKNKHKNLYRETKLRKKSTQTDTNSEKSTQTNTNSEKIYTDKHKLRKILQRQNKFRKNLAQTNINSEKKSTQTNTNSEKNLAQTNTNSEKIYPGAHRGAVHSTQRLQPAPSSGRQVRRDGGELE